MRSFPYFLQPCVNIQKHIRRGLSAHFAATCLRHGFSFAYHNMNRAICVALIISLLSTSTPAAPQVMTGLALQWRQQTAFWFASSGWADTFVRLFAGQFFLLDSDPEQEQQSVRDALVTSIKIYPEDVTVKFGESVIFSAVAYGTSDSGEEITISGVNFTWRAQDTDGQDVPFSPEGLFEASSAGTFTVSVEGAGRQAQTTVTVLGDDTYRTSSSEASIWIGGSGGESGGSRWWRDDIDNIHGHPPGMSEGNSNYQIVAPVLGLSGRGSNLALGLAYNSQLWNKAGTNIIFDADQGWPAPGWSLGFGKIVGLGIEVGSILVDADGTRHNFQGTITPIVSGTTVIGTHFVGFTTDGTFIDYEYTTGTNGFLNSAQAKLPNGTVIDYGAFGQLTHDLYPIRITDQNGNFVTIQYRSNGKGGEIDKIIDTVGRTIVFNYDTSGKLIEIKAPGLNTNDSMRSLVRFHYKSLTLGYNFPGLTPKGNASNNQIMPTSVMVLDAIYYPATATGYWFGDVDSYSPYGMIKKVSERRGMMMTVPATDQVTVTNAGVMSNESVYEYPSTSEALTKAPTFRTVTRRWDQMEDSTQPAVTTYEAVENSAERVMKIIGPKDKNGLQLRSVQHSIKNPDHFDHGLINKDEVYEVNGTTERLLQKSLVYWEEGNYKSPRAKSIEVTDELQQVKKAEFDYGPLADQHYNQVKELRNYDYDGTKLVRITDTEYENSSNYINRHIFNLVKSVEVWSPSADGLSKGRRDSLTQYQYDAGTLADASNVTQHSKAFNPYAPAVPVLKCHWECINQDQSIGCQRVKICETVMESPYNPATKYRGNVTKVTKYTDADQSTGPIDETRSYDITGNLVTTSTACCEETKFTYTSATNYAYPSSTTRGSKTIASKQVTISATYSLNTGLVLTTTDANGLITKTDYLTPSLRPKTVTAPTGATTTNTYDDAAMKVTGVTKTNTGEIAAHNVKNLNGLGQVINEQALGANNVWDYVDTLYDNLGQIWRQTRPYRTGETKQWSEVTYDVLGRVIKVKAPDGSETKTVYNEPQANRPDVATNAPGQTMRTVDAWGRERWGRTDVLGQLIEVVEPKPDGDGTVKVGGLLTEYTYDTLGNLTLIEQQSQQRKFQYDSLGRLTLQKLAETSAALNDSGQYVGINGTGAHWSDAFTYDEHSNLISRTDARGVKTVYNYNDDPLNRLQSVSFDTSGLHETTYPILPAPTVSYVYMTTGDLTQLNKVITDGVSTEEFGYDSQRRLNERTLTVTIPGSSNSTFSTVTSYVYDSLDRAQDMYYPAKTAGAVRKKVHYDYDAASRLKELKVDDVSFASAITYNPASQATSLNVGASISETYEYEGPTGLLKNQKVVRGSTPLLDLSYNYLRANTTSGRTGQLTKILNNKDHNRDRSYEYDQLGRLTKAAGGKSAQPLWTQSYTYDRYGNRKTVTASGVTANFFEPTAAAPSEPEEESSGSSNGGGSNQSSSGQSSPPPPGSIFFDIPEVIQAEDFGNGGVGGESYADGTGANLGGAQYRPETDVDIVNNDGGYYVGYTEAGEWLEYPLNIAVSDTYDIQAQVANLSEGGTFHVEIRQVGNTDPAQVYNTGVIAVPATGGNTSFQTVTKTGVHLTAGRYLMRVVMGSAPAGGITGNFDYFKIKPTSPSSHHTDFDFDGDGKTDIATYKPAISTDPNWAILNSSTSQAKGERNLGDSSQYQALPESQDKPAPADFDGDGKTDTAVWTPSTGNWLIKPSAGNPVRKTQQWGMIGDQPLPADYDGDGKADITVWRPSNGVWYILRSSDGATDAPSFGAPDDVAVPADYDGDGKTDIAVWRPSDGTWYILQSSNGTVRYQQWGLDGDVPVPGDYDGDHKTDIAVWRSSDTIWYILKSTDGTFWSPVWGLPTDIPARGDYNGDGRADVGVFRPNPTTGDWYVLETMNWTFNLQQQLGDESMMPVGASYTNHAPVARPGGQYRGVTNEDIHFDGSGSSDFEGPIKNYEWSFGDGSPVVSGANQSRPLHTYTSPGKYTVKLTVKDNGGRVASATTTAQVNDPIPADGLTSLTYNAATNRITTSGFEYDAAGNQTRIKRTNNTWERMEYDAAGRMVNVKLDNGTLLQSTTYGSSNQRLIVQEGSGSATTRTCYAWDGEAVIAEYSADGVIAATPQWKKSYVYMGSRLLATIALQPDGNSEAVQYHHPDQLGTRIITNATDSNVSEQATLPFGTALDSESSAAAATTNRRFTSYDRSMKTGLDYAVNRHYDPQQGRFTQVDPIGIGAASLSNPQSLNMYAYCGNDPVNHLDPSGLFWGKLFRFLSKALGILWKVVTWAVAIFVTFVAIVTQNPGMFVLAGLCWAYVLGGKTVQKIISLTGQVLGIYLQRPPTFYRNNEEIPELRRSLLDVLSVWATYLSTLGTISNFLGAAEDQITKAADNVEKILKLKGDCAKFFGPDALDVLKDLRSKLKPGPIKIQTSGEPNTSIGVRQSGTLTLLHGKSASGGSTLIGFSHEKATVNVFGPFLNKSTSSRPGGYEAATERSQAFQLLHELAHTVYMGGPLIPSDGDEGQESLSKQNSDLIYEKCHKDLETVITNTGYPK